MSYFIMWLRYIQEQSRQDYLPGLKVFYGHLPFLQSGFLIEAIGVFAYHALHCGFKFFVLRQIQARVCEQQLCRLVLCPLQKLHICAQICHVHLRQTVLA
jgi:hypothetical protein